MLNFIKKYFSNNSNHERLVIIKTVDSEINDLTKTITKLVSALPISLQTKLFKNHIENEINQTLLNVNFLTKITIMNYLSTIKLFIHYLLSLSIEQIDDELRSRQIVNDKVIKF
jgi:ribosome biogenesis protein Nip4